MTAAGMMGVTDPEWADKLRISKIQDRLFIGSMFDCRDYDRLRLIGITAIANMTPDDFGAAEEGFAYHCVGVDDSEDIPPEAIDRFIRWMDEHYDLGHTVMAHCHAGISRAPSFTIAWLMHRQGCHAGSDLRTAWSRAEDFIGKRRPVIHPHYKLKRSVLRYFEGRPAA